MKYLFTCFGGLWLICLLPGCEPKEEMVTANPRALLEFSTDSVKFDTIFVNTGSVSHAVWVYNRHAGAVKIAEIKLARANPAYQLIIDGQETNHARDILLRGKDSLLVLVKVTIPPTADTAAFIQEDALFFLTNTNQQQVALVSYGQNAYFHQKAEIATNTTWPADKPHVIYTFARVQPGVTLTIEKGARIYFHKDAALVVNGSLRVKGTAKKRVVFAGDRREPFYREVPGQWQGIKFEAASKNNVVEFADIKNATYGLWAANPDQDPSDYDLEIAQSVIQNMFRTGIVSHGADVRAVNTLITNCGQSAVQGDGGGNYEFIYCTLANYTRGFRPESVTVSLSDQLQNPNGQNQAYRVKLRLQNSIIWAGKRSIATYQDQIRLANEGGTTPQWQVEHSILQTERYKTEPAFSCCQNLLNVDPKFKNTGENLISDRLDFRLDTLSPASNQAKIIPGILKDLEDKARHSITPDPGAYERINP